MALYKTDKQNKTEKQTKEVKPDKPVEQTEKQKKQEEKPKSGTTTEVKKQQPRYFIPGPAGYSPYYARRIEKGGIIRIKRRNGHKA